MIHLFDYPYEESSESIKAAFKVFGSVKSLRNQKYSSNDQICTGTRLIDLVMEKTPPRLLLINGHVCRVWFKGQPIICNIDGLQGHKTSDCPDKNKCHLRHEEGHLARQCTNPWTGRPCAANPAPGANATTDGSAARTSAPGPSNAQEPDISARVDSPMDVSSGVSRASEPPANTHAGDDCGEVPPPQGSRSSSVSSSSSAGDSPIPSPEVSETPHPPSVSTERFVSPVLSSEVSKVTPCRPSPTEDEGEKYEDASDGSELEIGSFSSSEVESSPSISDFSEESQSQSILQDIKKTASKNRSKSTKPAVVSVVNNIQSATDVSHSGEHQNTDLSVPATPSGGFSVVNVSTGASDSAVDPPSSSVDDTGSAMDTSETRKRSRKPPDDIVNTENSDNDDSTPQARKKLTTKPGCHAGLLLIPSDRPNRS